MTAQTNKQIAYRCLNQYADSPPPGGYLLDVIRDAERIEEALDAKDAALLEADKNGYERGRREGQLVELIFMTLIRLAGAVPDDFQQFQQFEMFMEESGATEFRFQGKLGFGGKFWKDRMRVTCYPEDENAERLKIIDATNKALARLAPSDSGGEKQP